MGQARARQQPKYIHRHRGKNDRVCIRRMLKVNLLNLLNHYMKYISTCRRYRLDEITEPTAGTGITGTGTISVKNYPVNTPKVRLQYLGPVSGITLLPKCRFETSEGAPNNSIHQSRYLLCHATGTAQADSTLPTEAITTSFRH